MEKEGEVKDGDCDSDSNSDSNNNIDSDSNSDSDSDSNSESDSDSDSDSDSSASGSPTPATTTTTTEEDSAPVEEVRFDESRRTYIITNPSLVVSLLAPSLILTPSFDSLRHLTLISLRWTTSSPPTTPTSPSHWQRQETSNQGWTCRSRATRARVGARRKRGFSNVKDREINNTTPQRALCDWNTNQKPSNFHSITSTMISPFPAHLHFPSTSLLTVSG